MGEGLLSSNHVNLSRAGQFPFLPRTSASGTHTKAYLLERSAERFWGAHKQQITTPGGLSKAKEGYTYKDSTLPPYTCLQPLK